MKFAKELEEDLVPEWRVKYFNYKLGKKKIKAVSRALRAASKTPATPGRPHLSTAFSTDRIPYTHYDFTRRSDDVANPSPPQPKQSKQPKNAAQAFRGLAIDTSNETNRRESVTLFALSPPVPQPQRGSEDDATGDDEEGTDLSEDSDNNDETPLRRTSSQPTPYGRQRIETIPGSPPERSNDTLPALHLPDPALHPSQQQTLSPNVTRLSHVPTDAPEYWDRSPQKRKLSTWSKKIVRRKARQNSDADKKSNPVLSRAFNPLTLNSPAVSRPQVDAYRDLDTKQDEFFSFLDKELDKIEKFYRAKEEEASARLRVLREQLHEMRDRRLEDVQTIKKGGKIADKDLFDGQIPVMSDAAQDESPGSTGVLRSITESIMDMFRGKGEPGQTSQAREELGTPRTSAQMKPSQSNDRGDYVRKQQGHEKVPYRFARRKLKLALQEFYRGLELLKSYSLLNRTAFRKINKKYDKAVNARPPLQYMAGRINGAYFVTSVFVEETMMMVEDLYARYFERGNRKIAVNKLRSHLQTADQSGVSFRNGIYVAAGVGFAITALIDGSGYLFSDDQETKLQASYLFQLYGGYFLAVLMFLFFVINCRIWTRNRINYTFVFEYDARHTLNWRELAELPCFFLFLNGLFFWINFQFHEQHVMYLYWPILLIGVTVVIIFLPFKIFYYHARKWWLFSNWRLLLAGLYPVEFRDFYLGDMYCSETYTMSQIEIFFCLYSRHWTNAEQCNSNHSRLLGFLTALPAVWRALQCLRRYYDSRNWFPHLANFAKYCCNILYYMSLSIYRIHLSKETQAVMITFAIINGIYCSFWDVFMDFSLGSPWSKNFLLRDQLAFRKKWIYYAVMVFDVVLRQQWILYAIFTEDVQHSAVMSFVVALAEVFRRGVWSVFRVENEHCNNVQQFRASRDIPLPYDIPESPELGPKSDANQKQPDRAKSSAIESHDLERTSTTNTSLRQRRGSMSQSTPGLAALRRVGTVIAAAHAQDFQKKRPVESSTDAPDSSLVGRRVSDSSDGTEDEEEGQGQGGSSELDLTSREDVRGTVRQRPTRREEGDASGSGSGSGSRPRSNRAERGSSANAPN